MKDELGERIKENYENRTRFSLPRRMYTIIRLDGKAFHTFTRHFKRPYDTSLMDMMDKAAIGLCEQVQGVKFAFVQSDEISLVLTDFDEIKTSSWFDGNLQKISSISASIATAEFIREYMQIFGQDLKPSFWKAVKLPNFDSRAFPIADINEVLNYFIWRQQDATRNSIQMGAQALYSQKELHGKNTSQLQELMFQKGVNWNDYPVGFKRGRVIAKEEFEWSGTNKKTGETVVATRSRWAVKEPPVFTQDKSFLLDRLPKIGESRENGDKAN